MKKIVFLVTQLEGGGAQSTVIKLLKGFRERGHFAEAWFLYRKRDAFLNVQKVHTFLDHPPNSFTDYLVIIYRLFKQLVAYKPYALYSFTHYSNIIGQPLAFVVGVKNRIASQRNPSCSYPFVAKLIDKIIGSTRIYTNNIMVSRAVSKSFNDYPLSYLNKTQVIYNGFEEKKVDPSKIQKEFNIYDNNDQILFLNVGRLSRQKNQKVIIKAVTKFENARLIIVGEGEMRNDLESFLERESISNVDLIGEIAHQDVLNMMSSADVFLMPSKFEGMSNALLEALTYGLPVIASDIPPNREVLEENGQLYGLLVDENDVGDWVTAIEEMILDVEKRKKLKSLSKKRSQVFSIEKMVDDFEKIIL